MLTPTLCSALAGAALSFLLVFPGLAQEPGTEGPPETPLSACTENLETTKLVLTMWFVDHEDKYPEAIDALVPDYLVQLLRCSTAGGRDYTYERDQDGKGFMLTCPGDHKAEGESDAPFTINDPETESGVRSLKPDR